MKSTVRSYVTAAALAAGMMISAQSASALPAGGMYSATAGPSTTSHVEQIRYYGRGRGFGWGGVGAGLLAGALIGGALTSPYYYSNPYYARPYYPVAPAYGPGPGGDAVAYCASRFRSYDPRSGTYMGYDGLRHPCP